MNMAGDRDHPAAESVAICTRYRGVDGPGSVGGDFYARCETAGRTRVIIGDVRGKGAPAACKARFLTDAFSALALAASDLEALSDALDRLVRADAAAESEAAAREWFATAVLLEVDELGRRVTVINHGHPSPVLVGPGMVRELAPRRARLPLGLGELTPVHAVADTVELSGDAMLLLFTDGVSEARDRAGRMFDPVAWLAKAQHAEADGDVPVRGDAVPVDPAPADVPSSPPDDPARLLDRLYLEVERHNGGTWHDDLALVSVRRRRDDVPGSPGSPARQEAPTRAVAPQPRRATSEAPPVPAQHKSGPRPPLPHDDGHPPIPTPAPGTVTMPPARAPASQGARRPVAPARSRAPRNPPPPCVGRPTSSGAPMHS